MEEQEMQWQLLNDMKVENLKLQRSLRRQRWVWRGLTFGALAASIALTLHSDKVEKDEQ